MNYKAYLEKIYPLKYSRTNLDSIYQLDKALGHPSKDFKSVHVAGTNGKGSVSTKIAKGLELSGLKTGLFTSPHIACYRERMRINEILITEAEVIKHLDTIFSVIKTEQIPASFFDITTLLSFLYFSNHAVDFVVFETGIGGRLDATNIIHPVLTIITSISLDHTDILGNDLNMITKEKAGIIKHGIPILIGPTVNKEIIELKVRETKSPLTAVNEKFNVYNDANNCIAKKGMELLNLPADCISLALKAMPSCRMEKIQFNNCLVILDVAHNVDGFYHLFKALKIEHPMHRFRAVLGISKGKDLENCLKIIENDVVHFYPVAAENARSVPVDYFKNKLKSASYLNSIAEAIHKAISDANSEKEIVIVCGSFFIMKEARKALGINEYRDPN